MNGFFPTLIEYLIQKESSVFTFDFSGNGESEGEFGFANYDIEVNDLQCVIQYLRDQSYFVEVLIGHSKGANVAMLYSAQEDDVPYVVSISGRFVMNRRSPNLFTREEQKELEEKGVFAWQERTLPNGQKRIYYVTQVAVEEKCKLDMSIVKNIEKTQVLIIHGTKDTVIPTEDSIFFHQTILRSNEPGATRKSNSTLYIMEDADHSFQAKNNLLNEVIVNWLREKRNLKQESKV